jgi:nucleoid-associated protein YgaU
MDGQKDEATLRYEREIRIGMSLLGVLSLLFFGVLAFRIWVENPQTASTTKKPIYLTKAERDELRSRARPLPISSIHAASPVKRINRAASSETESVAARTEIDPDAIPELEITPAGAEVGALDEPSSKPANFLKSEEPATKSPEPLPLVDPARRVQKTSRFSEPVHPEHEDESTETSLETAEKREPFAEEAKPNKPKPLRPAAMPPVSSDPQTLTEAPAEEAAEETAESAPAEATPPPREEPQGEVIRKKVAKNPWKSAATPGKALAARKYTVQLGDSLKSISKAILGAESKWQELYDLNRSEIGDDYLHLPEGLKLNLPAVDDEPPQDPNPAASGAKINSPK